MEVPVIGKVAAGAPILAQENITDHVRIDSMLLGDGGRKVFALRVAGDSMIGDGIFDGDYIFVRKQLQASPGEIVVAMIEDEATVKRYYPEGDRIRFQPSNPRLKPIYVRPRRLPRDADHRRGGRRVPQNELTCSGQSGRKFRILAAGGRADRRAPAAADTSAARAGT